MMFLILMSHFTSEAPPKYDLVVEVSVTSAPPLASSPLVHGLVQFLGWVSLSNFGGKCEVKCPNLEMTQNMEKSDGEYPSFPASFSSLSIRSASSLTFLSSSVSSLAPAAPACESLTSSNNLIRNLPSGNCSLTFLISQLINHYYRHRPHFRSLLGFSSSLTCRRGRENQGRNEKILIHILETLPRF